MASQLCVTCEYINRCVWQSEKVIYCEEFQEAVPATGPVFSQPSNTSTAGLINLTSGGLCANCTVGNQCLFSINNKNVVFCEEHY